MVSEVIFEVRDDEIDGGLTASAVGYGIHTQADTMDELKKNIKEAVECYFESPLEMPAKLRLHYVKDENKKIIR